MIVERPPMQMEAGGVPHTYIEVEGTYTGRVEGGVIEERYLTIYVNAQELATLMFSPLDHEALALGFLYNEGVIETLREVGYIKRNVSGSVVDVFLNHNRYSIPRRMVITSGCSGGITTQDLTASHAPLESPFITSPQAVYERMRDLHRSARLYQQVRGVHAAVIASESDILASAEDVGRHNAVDKVAGKMLQSGLETRDTILLSSGRISSEMLGKARRMGIPLVASRTAPTSLAIQLAEAWNITIAGYVRSGSMRVYTHPQRLKIAP